jgi:hypothetical protein
MGFVVKEATRWTPGAIARLLPWPQPSPQGTLRCERTPRRAGQHRLSNRQGHGVTYIDKATGRRREARANVDVVASTIESIRLLLNSAAAKHPNGWAIPPAWSGAISWTRC